MTMSVCPVNLNNGIKIYRTVIQQRIMHIITGLMHMVYIFRVTFRGPEEEALSIKFYTP